MTDITLLQKEIHYWANEVFPEREFKTTLAKLVLEEIPEFCITPNAEELADIVILIFDLASMNGINVDSALAEKMKINRGRTWEKDETGLFYNHVKGKANEHS